MQVIGKAGVPWVGTGKITFSVVWFGRPKGFARVELVASTVEKDQNFSE